MAWPGSLARSEAKMADPPVHLDSVETDRPVPLERQRAGGKGTKGEIEFAAGLVAGGVERERCGGSDPRP